MVPRIWPCSVLYVIFVWVLGLCYGFVLLSSAAGHNGDIGLFEPGEFSTYEWYSKVLLDDRDSGSQNVGFYVSGDVKIKTVWGQNADRILRVEVTTPNLHVKSRKAPAPDGYVSHSSKLEQISNRPFLVIWSNGKIQKILLPKGEPTSLANLKKGVASLLQIQFMDGAYEETDASGHCLSTYTATSPTKILKSKSHCAYSDFRYAGYFEPILGVQKDSSRTLEYELDSTGSYLKSVISKESHVMYIKANNNLGNILTVEHSLKYMSGQKTDIIQSGNIQEAIEQISKELGVTFTQESLLTEREDKKDSAPTLTKPIDSLRNSLTSDKLGTLESAKAFLRLVDVARNSKKEDIDKAVKSKKNQKILPQIYDILGYAQTTDSHAAVMKNIHIDRPPDLDLLERYLWSISLSAHPNPEIIEDLLNKFNKYEAIPAKAKETLILTLASMCRNLRESKHKQQQITTAVKQTILNNLDYAQSEDKYVYFRALKNLRDPSSIPVLLNYVNNGTLKEELLAWKTINSFDTGRHFFNGEIIDVAKKTFFQLGKKRDSSSRVLALDVILETFPGHTDYLKDELLNDILSFLASNETNYELKQYTYQRIKMIADENPAFQKRVQNILSRNPHINNYSGLAPRGLSTALSRNIFKSDSSSANLISLQEVKDGMFKRGTVDIVMQKDIYSTEIFSLGMFATGLNSIISSEGGNDEEEEESATAGMELTLFGNQIRPFVFFNGSGELMGHVWSGTASERTPAYQALILVQDHEEHLRLGNGFIAELNVKGAVSYEMSGKIEISLWNRNSQALIENSAGIMVTGSTKLDSEFVGSNIEFVSSIEPKLVLEIDGDFSSDVKMCMRLSQPESVFRHNTFKVERIPGSKHKLRISRYKKRVVPGKSFALNRKNNEMCNEISR